MRTPPAGRIDAVCFDLDGTLVDSRPGIERSLREAIAEILPGREGVDIGSAIGPPLPQMLERLLPDHPDEHAAIVTAFGRRYDAEGWQQAEPYPGILEALDSLAAAALTLYVVTNKRSAPTRLILGAPPFAGRFAQALSLDSVEPPYPDKAHALAALLAGTGGAPAHCVYVGDSTDDRVTAQAAGCPFVAVHWGYGEAARERDPHDLGVITSPAELCSLLLPVRNER